VSSSHGLVAGARRDDGEDDQGEDRERDHGEDETENGPADPADDADRAGPALGGRPARGPGRVLVGVVRRGSLEVLNRLLDLLLHLLRNLPRLHCHSLVGC
jgi:hypothetical protein